MSNISITLSCGRKCGYCFAKGLKMEPRDMPLDTFAEAAALLARSGQRLAPVLGGEPTLHPLFGQVIDIVEEAGLDLLLFTGGGAPAKALERLERFPADRLAILLNIDPGALPEGLEGKSLRRLLELFGPSISPGANIWHPGVSPWPLLGLIDQFGLGRAIRLGLAHPSLAWPNRFLHPRHYPSVGASLSPFIVEAQRRGIRLELDCGFVPCMFSPEIYQLLASSGDPPGSRCNPLPDYLPSGDMIPCYPLAGVCRTALRPLDTVASVRARLGERLSVYAGTGIYPQCRHCPVRGANLCSGGCRAAALMRLRPAPPDFSRLGLQESQGLQGLQSASEPGEKPKASQTASREMAASQTASRETASPPSPQSSPQEGQPMGSASPPKASFPGPSGERRREGQGPLPPERWSIPYIDQPISFWRDLERRFGPSIEAVYLPLPSALVPSGRPPQKRGRMDAFIREAPFPVSALINPVVLPRPASIMAPAVIAELKRLQSITRLSGATIADLNLALAVKEAMPDLPLTASTLMEAHAPGQARQLAGVFDYLVPASRAMRDLRALSALAAAFPGELRLIVNEGCLPGCLMRTQHFYEMGYSRKAPESLCRPMLLALPWLRLTGAWALPQHLGFFGGITSHFKLAGRATLKDPARYLEVLGAYIEKRPLTPDAIGGGPASPLDPIFVSGVFYLETLKCGKNCLECRICQAYHDKAAARLLKAAGAAAL